MIGAGREHDVGAVDVGLGRVAQDHLREHLNALAHVDVAEQAQAVGVEGESPRISTLYSRARECSACTTSSSPCIGDRTGASRGSQQEGEERRASEGPELMGEGARHPDRYRHDRTRA